MKITKNFKLDVYKILIVVSWCFSFNHWTAYFGKNKYLENELEGLSYVDFLNSRVQRTAKVVLEGILI